MTTTEPTTGFLLVPADLSEPCTVLEYKDPDSTLGTLQEAVGGYVECVHVSDMDDTGIDMWLHDEGKFRYPGELNARAQLLWDSRFGMHTDVIMGPAVVTGGPDHEGETLPLTAEQIMIVRVALGENHRKAVV